MSSHKPQDTIHRKHSQTVGIPGKNLHEHIASKKGDSTILCGHSSAALLYQGRKYFQSAVAYLLRYNFFVTRASMHREPTFAV